MVKATSHEAQVVEHGVVLRLGCSLESAGETFKIIMVKSLPQSI